jgi:nitrous oxide reductase
VRTDPRRRAIAVTAALALALAFAGCGHGTAHRSIAATAVNGAPGFFPTSIVVSQEETVVLKVGNGTDKVHGFTIEGYKIAKTVEPNQTVNIKFRASRGGTFKIFCQLHPAHQTATLIVQ